VTIIIIAIICHQAKAKGLQYTKRLLPDFVAPRANIRLDNTKQAYENGQIVEDACLTMGCIDIRTAKFHLKALENSLLQAEVSLSCDLSHYSGQIAPPELTPDLSPLERLQFLAERMNLLFDSPGCPLIKISVTSQLQKRWPLNLINKSIDPVCKNRPPPAMVQKK
jgi:hypothetical protein